MTEFITTESNVETGVSKSISKESYLDAITSYTREDGTTRYDEAGWLFGIWRNSKIIYLENDSLDIDKAKKESLKLKKEAHYINAYTVCKLWYEVNN